VCSSKFPLAESGTQSMQSYIWVLKQKKNESLHGHDKFYSSPKAMLMRLSLKVNEGNWFNGQRPHHNSTGTRASVNQDWLDYRSRTHLWPQDNVSLRPLQRTHPSHGDKSLRCGLFIRCAIHAIQHPVDFGKVIDRSLCLMIVSYWKLRHGAWS
jgi:hypothetical protein